MPSSPITPTFPYRGGNQSTSGKGSPVQPYSSNSVQNPYGPNASNRVSFQFWSQPVYKNADGTYWAPGFDGPTYASSAWDYVYIGLPMSGTPLTPGIARVRVNKARNFDKKKAAGSDGARVTFHGVDPAQVDIEITIWTPEQLRQLSLMWPVLFPQAYKGTPPAFSVQHPAFTSGLHAIKSLQFISMEGPDIGHDRTGKFTLRAIEYLQPGKANATNTATAPLPTLYDQGAAPAVSTPGSQSENLAP